MDVAVAEFLNRYQSLGLSGSPLAPEKVEALERHFGLPLPAAYRAYLLMAGARTPLKLVGSHCHGDYLFLLRGWAEELLQRSGRPFELPADAVVFMMH